MKLTREELALSATEEDIKWHLERSHPLYGGGRLTRPQARYAYADTMISEREKCNEETPDRRIHAIEAMIRSIADHIGPVCASNAEVAYQRVITSGK